MYILRERFACPSWMKRRDGSQRSQSSRSFLAFKICWTILIPNRQLKLKPTISLRRIAKPTKKRLSILLKKIQPHELRGLSPASHLPALCSLPLSFQGKGIFHYGGIDQGFFSSLGVPGRKVKDWRDWKLGFQCVCTSSSCARLWFGISWIWMSLAAAQLSRPIF